MKLLDYQSKTGDTAIYPDENAREYLCLGLMSEAGEIGGVAKKSIRDNDGVMDVAKLDDELGDLMYYISELANLYGINLEYTLDKNITKLQDRKARGVLGGSGDKR